MFILFACLCLVISAAAATPSDYSVACYVDTSTRRLFHYVNPSLCTYVISLSAYIDENNTFQTVSQDANTGCFSLKTLKERNSSVKMMLGVEIKKLRVEQLNKDQSSLETFVDSTLEYLKEENYDGLALNWVETTAHDEPPRTRETLASLLKELKRQIGEDTDLANKSVLVSVSLPYRNDHSSMPNDEKMFSQYVDFISLLPASLEKESQIADNAVEYWQDQGVDPKKVLVALPALLWRSRRREHRRRLETENLNPEKMEQLYGPGLVIAKQVCLAVKSEQTELKTLTKLESTQSLGEEVSWLLQKGLGGVGVVVLDIGNFADSMCHNLSQSEKALLESKVISVSPHHSHPRGQGPHSRHGPHHGHHRPHNRDSRVSPSQEDANDTGHRHGHRHGHHNHGHGHHGHFHHCRGHCGSHGHRSGHGHEAHSHHHRQPSS